MDWSLLDSAEKLREYYLNNPELQTLPRKDKRVVNFYAAMERWLDSQVSTDISDKELRKNIRQSIVSRRIEDRSNLKTLEDWQEEFNRHPEWQGLNTKEIEKIGGGFYQAFSIWAKKEVEKYPEEERQEKLSLIKETLFPNIQKTWNFTEIEQWEKYFKNHPEWQSNKQIREKTNFLAAFGKWTKDQVKDLPDPEKIQKIIKN